MPFIRRPSLKRDRLFWLLLTGLLLTASGYPLEAYSQDLPSVLQDASVTIRTEGGQGSGVLFTRGDKSFVWTCGHVVEDLRQTREVIREGKSLTLVEFKDAEVVQEFRQDGRRVGDSSADATVIKYSDSEAGHDLALLLIRKRGYSDQCVTFAKDDVPNAGIPLFHVGSLHGQFGSNSVTDGVLSQVGRVLDLGPSAVVFDQVSTPSFPGSSGGGVFRKADGAYIGMLVRGAGETFGFIVPARRIWSFARENSISWAVDPSVPVPSDEELAKITVEDTASGSASGASWDSITPDPASQALYPFKIAYPASE